MNTTQIPADEFTSALERYATRYGVKLTTQATSDLRRYYEHVSAWNARLHLVAPCSPTEFATRHVLESLLAVPFLTTGARLADVGSGAGLPAIPCLIIRPDIRLTMIEANAKKSIFLRECLRLLDARHAAKVIAARFETLPLMEVDFISCRALDRLTEMLPRLLVWSPHDSTQLLFGGPLLETELKRHALDYQAVRIPESERRFLFVAHRPSNGSRTILSSEQQL